MASVFAVVSKKVYETQARQGGKVLGIGHVWPTAKYASTHASLKPLGEGGHIFLVTVRPPEEALWLVAVLRDVKSVKDGWESAPNSVAITDISSLKKQIKFANGAGITAAAGKLGMSLQTPRALSAPDVALLLGVAAGTTPVAALAPEVKAPVHVNRHESKPKLPCLCKKCFDKAGERVEVNGDVFVRRAALAKGRVLYFWLPELLVATEKKVTLAVEQRMQQMLKDLRVAQAKPKNAKKKASKDEDDE